MSLLEKVVFLADYIEPGRTHPGVERVREAARHDLDRAALLALDQTIVYLVERGELIAPDAVRSAQRPLDAWRFAELGLFRVVRRFFLKAG